ncbi:MAG: hypothetical protein FWC79_08745 [Oscillospiraceae bacterium]|nr:hypothetical protein [Oscillospiraceae bacterium]
MDYKEVVEAMRRDWRVRKLSEWARMFDMKEHELGRICKDRDGKELQSHSGDKWGYKGVKP